MATQAGSHAGSQASRQAGKLPNRAHLRVQQFSRPVGQPPEVEPGAKARRRQQLAAPHLVLDPERVPAAAVVLSFDGGGGQRGDEAHKALAREG